MASVIKRADGKGVWYQVRWSHEGKGQTLHEDNRADAEAAKVWLEGLGHRIAKTDPRVVGKEYLRGYDAAITFAERKKVADAPTFGEVAAELIERKTYKVAKGTLVGYQVMARRHITDLKHLSVASIDHKTLNNVYYGLLGKGLQENTAEGVMAKICEVMDFAYGQHYCDFDVRRAKTGRRLDFDSPTQRATEARDGLSVDQVYALAEAMPTEADRLIVLVMATTGARIGEVLALACGDVDLSTGLLHIGHRMLGASREVGTKGSRGGRVGKAHAITLPSFLLDHLEGWIGTRGPVEPLFPWRGAGGYGRLTTRVFPVAEDWRSDVFRPAVAMLAGKGILPPTVTPHWLRHTAASRMGNHLPTALVQGQMRHGKAATTALYMHRDQETIDVTRRGLDGIWSPLHQRTV